jgi:hypothetical protein
MCQRLSQGNDPNDIGPLDKHNDHNTSAEHNDANPTIFAIILSIIEGGQHWPGENLPGIGKVKAVLSEVALVFSLIPFEAHE